MFHFEEKMSIRFHASVHGESFAQPDRFIIQTRVQFIFGLIIFIITKPKLSYIISLNM